jgi:DedD protein
MFKLRSGGQGGSGPAQTPSIESIRRQARQRLIGASVLVLAGIIGLPWLFDTQPRPVPVDLAISIPARDAVPPLDPPRLPDAVSVTPEREEVLAPPAATTAPASPPAPSAPPAPPAPTKSPVSPPAPAPAPVPPASDAARAQALLEGRTAPAASRVVVQVGAFAEQARAQEVRMRLERAGLKTYTQVANTAEGPRIRVRVGPFDNRVEAEKAAEAVKKLGLPASILTL